MRAGWLAGGGRVRDHWPIVAGSVTPLGIIPPGGNPKPKLRSLPRRAALVSLHPCGVESPAVETTPSLTYHRSPTLKDNRPDPAQGRGKDRRRSFVVQSHSISSQDACNDCLNNILNAERRGKRQVLIRPSSKVIIRFLTVMQKHGYIDEFEYIDDHRSGKIVVQLNGRINKCGVVSPRFNVPLDQIENWVDRLMPARSFGIIILTTSAGIMDHEEARRKHVAGKILGYVF
ncbi:hypothetical protein PSTG_07734 [Puccinia striiformis f. sp. tritici PST-78]|uniref:40S ribosomal protein S22 n=1 Tax=Puccinia striiformis f. sp. tritici PST-78 TaxID=1165861 RepID=A0A0L0VIJ4_9BASI|nr:hypothetical protein PSTG_07734 [Puccinia striiformis f. sp. tritici PST-78]